MVRRGVSPAGAVANTGSGLDGRERRRGVAGGATSVIAALALVLLTQMLLILGLSTALQYIVFGAAIIAGMLISGDRVASLLGRALRPSEAPPAQPAIGNNTS